jgi:hypothetical protein
MTMMTIQSQVDTEILSLAGCRLYGEPDRSCNARVPHDLFWRPPCKDSCGQTSGSLRGLERVLAATPTGTGYFFGSVASAIPAGSPGSFRTIQ